jgi:hypothetical protein
MIIKKRYRSKILKALINIDDFKLIDNPDAGFLIFYQTNGDYSHFTFHIKIFSKVYYLNYFPKQKILKSHVPFSFFGYLMKSGFEKIVRRKLRELIGC